MNKVITYATLYAIARRTAVQYTGDSGNLQVISTDYYQGYTLLKHMDKFKETVILHSAVQVYRSNK